MYKRKPNGHCMKAVLVCRDCNKGMRNQLILRRLHCRRGRGTVLACDQVLVCLSLLRSDLVTPVHRALTVPLLSVTEVRKAPIAPGEALSL